VSPAENGSGVASVTEAAYNVYGNATFRRDAMGYVTAFSYNLATGAMVEKIDDADLSLLPNAPDGWSNLLVGGAHLVSNYETDAEG